MAAHVVHADAAGNLAVIAMLLETSGANQLIESLWNRVPPQPGPEQQYDGVPINVGKIYPHNARPPRARNGRKVLESK